MTRQNLMKVSKHPLVVLLVGTLLGSILIPWINGRAARAAELEKLKTQKAMEALAANTDVDRRVNIIITAFESFWKDTLPQLGQGAGAAPRREEAARPTLQKQVYELYREFDRSAWWWLEEGWKDSQLLGLIGSEEAEKAKGISERYKSSLMTTTDALSKIWEISLRPGQQTTAEEAIRTVREVRQIFYECRSERLKLTGEFTALLLGGKASR